MQLLGNRLGDGSEGDTSDEASSEEQVVVDSDEEDDIDSDSNDERPLAEQARRQANKSERCMHAVTFRVILLCTL